MYFLLALGMFLFIGIRYSSDRSKSNAFQKNMDVMSNDFDNFCQKYAASSKQTSDVKQMIIDANPNMARFEDELRDIVGIVPTHPMLIWGYLAKSGKVPYDAGTYQSDSPFSNQHDGIWSAVTIWQEYTVEEIREARKKFLLWYDKTLQENGMEYPLMASEQRGDERDVNGNSIYHIQDAKVLDSQVNISKAAIFWMPMRGRVHNLYGNV